MKSTYEILTEAVKEIYETTGICIEDAYIDWIDVSTSGGNKRHAISSIKIESAHVDKPMGKKNE